jgi:hypothetical protein
MDEDPELARTDSEEQINKYNAVPLKIYQHREVKISTHKMDAKDEELFAPHATTARATRNHAKDGLGGGGSDVDSISDRSAAEVVTVCRGV